MWKIPLFDLNYDEKEKKAVNDVIESKWLSMGQKTEEFENNFSEYLKGKDYVFSAAVANCTAALHLSLLANHIGRGDEVIISGLTFVAALNVVNTTGATAVLADSKSFEDWNVSPQEIAAKITPRTKAVLIVHYAGYPCDMDEILKITGNNKLIVIEDTAHAPGAEYKEQKCGTMGDIGCFSFFSNKNLSTGEGGMIVTKNRELCGKFKLLRAHGMTSTTIDRYSGKTVFYDVGLPGLNYRIDEIRSALGVEQLKKLDENNKRRKKIVEGYRSLLSEVEEIKLPWLKLDEDKTSAYHIFPILLAQKIDRKKIMDYMREKGIQTSVHYPAFNQFTCYKKVLKERLPVAEAISARALTLPLYSGMNERQIEYICENLKKALIL